MSTGARIGTITFLILVISFVIINSTVEVLGAEGDTRITLFKVSTKSVYYGETISFTGKLIDGLGYAMGGETITIWDYDNPDYQYITSTITSARGEFKASTIAEYWDGKGDPVEIVAYFSGSGIYKSTRTSIIEINIDKPYASSIPQTTQTYETPKTSTNISLSVRDGNREGAIQVFPIVETDSGKKLGKRIIRIYENGEIVKTTSSNEWSSDIYLGIGTHTIKASYLAGTSSYIGSSKILTVHVQTSKPAINYYNTQLTLQVIDGSSQGYIKVKPTLTYGSGIKLSNYDVSIYVDKEHKGKVKSDQWSSNIYTKQPGHQTIEAYFVETTSNFDSSIRYRASSDSELYFVKAATSGGSISPPSSPSPGVTSNDIFPIEYVIVAVVITAAVAGVGIALSKRKKAAPMVYASPAKAQAIQSKDDTQFWVCPNCGQDTQMKDGRQYCFSCKIYLSI